MMFDEIFECVKTRDVSALCYIICENFFDSKKKLIHVFIELYAKYYSMTVNTALLKGLHIRLTKLSEETNKAKGCRLMLELFLLLYYSKINLVPNYVPKNSQYEHSDLCILINDSSNKDACKDICFKTIKNKSQNKVSFKIVDEKHRNDSVWLIWFELMKISHITSNKDLSKWIKLQLNIFIFEYGKTQVKNRIQILFSIIDMIAYTNNTTNKSQGSEFALVMETIIKRSFLEIMFKVDYILQEKNLIKPIKKREYLGMIAMLQFPDENTTIKSIQKMHTCPPEKKQIQTISSNKICFHKIIKKIDDQ